MANPEEVGIQLDDLPLIRQAAMAGYTMNELAREMNVPMKCVREFLKHEGAVYLSRFDWNAHQRENHMPRP